MPNATVKWLQNKQFVGIDSSKHAVVVSTQDEANAVGCKPAELLLVALGSCVAVDVVDILAKKRMPLSDFKIELKGEQDPEPPWAFRKIHLTFHVWGHNLTPTGVEQAIHLAEEKYCSVSATVKGVAQVTWDYRIESSASE